MLEPFMERLHGFRAACVEASSAGAVEKLQPLPASAAEASRGKTSEWGVAVTTVSKLYPQTQSLCSL